MISLMALRIRYREERQVGCDNLANLFSFLQKHPSFVPTATRSEESKTR